MNKISYKIRFIILYYIDKAFLHACSESMYSRCNLCIEKRGELVLIYTCAYYHDNFIF